MIIRDLINKKFNRLLVKKYLFSDKDKHKVYECQCDCGNIKSLVGSCLSSGRIKSCGCLVKEPRKSRPEQAKRHIGEKHYFLTITGIEPNIFTSQRGYFMSCQCDCGNTTRQRYSDIKRGQVKSCGCHQREQASKTGSKCGLNNWTGNGKNHKWFLIENGVKKKARSGYEVIFSMIMNKQNIPFQYEPKEFVLQKGMRYTPDFYLPKTNEWVETKGFLKPIAVEKMNEFRRQGNKLKLLELKELEKMFGCCYITFIRRWDKGLYK